MAVMPPQNQLFRTILCPLDFSEHSRHALSHAALLAARNRGQLIALFVEDPVLAAAAAVAYDEKTLRDKARTELRGLVERAASASRVPMKSTTIQIAVGKPHEELPGPPTALVPI